jgi:hypothetical protein
LNYSLFGYKSGIRLKDLVFIAYAGMIRGAVAFGLVLRIDPDEVEHRSVIVTTSLALVCFTTIFLGSTVATVQRCLFGKVSHEEEHGDPNTSHYGEVLHPNLEDEKAAPATPTPEGGKKKSGCLHYLKRLDVAVIKPMLIYKYEQSAHKKQKEYFEMLMKEGQKLEEIYAAAENAGNKSQLIEIMTGKAKEGRAS